MLKMIVAFTLCVLGTSTAHAQTSSSGDSLKNSLPWPQGKLAFELHGKTVATSSWCQDDLGTQYSYLVNIVIQHDTVDGEYMEHKVIKFQTRNSRFSIKRNNFTAYLDNKQKDLVFSGELPDSEGVTNINKQVLHLHERGKVTGDIQWEWSDGKNHCTGRDKIEGKLNF